MRTINQDYRYIRKVIRSVDSTKQIRACERMIDNWLNAYTTLFGYERLITANRLRDYLYDQVCDKFPEFDYEPI